MSREPMKAVVLARGLGTRMRRANAAAQLAGEQAAIADAGVKAMIPFDRPFLDYVLSGLADAGYRHICLVIGPEHDAIRDYYENQALARVRLTYAIQHEPRGTADALLAAETFAAGREFVVMNSDNYYPVQALRALHDFPGPGTVLFESDSLVRHSNIPAERVRRYAYADVEHGVLLHLIEKPDPGIPVPPNALVSMNLWRFSPEIFEHCRNLPLSPRGEYELPVAVNRGIQSGMRLRVETSPLGVLDLSERGDIPVVAERLRGIQVAL
jgi:glucose-1-phosphate thymidylyltransferase